MKEYRVIGPPGTGKTTHLQGRISKAVQTYGPNRVVAMSFTRAAAAELVARDLPIPRKNVGTIHSFAYRAMERPKLVDVPGDAQTEWNESKNGNNWPILTGGSVNNQKFGEIEVALDESPGDESVWTEYQLARNKLIPQERWRSDVLELHKAFTDFKAETNYEDFTGLLEGAIKYYDRMPGHPLVLYVDEAQDLSALQLKLVRQWGENCLGFVIVGDSDQCLYDWAGASPQALELPRLPEEQMSVLGQSYRVPAAVVKKSLEWIGRLEDRRNVVYLPREFPGAVNYHDYPVDVDAGDIAEMAAEFAQDGRSVMILAPCGYQLEKCVKYMRQVGIPFGNKYRRKNARWNPLAETGKGVSLKQRINIYFNNPDLRIASGNLLAVVNMFNTKGVLNRGAKASLKRLVEQVGADTVVDDGEVIRAIFKSEALQALQNPSWDWLATHAMPKFNERIKYFKAVDQFTGDWTEEPLITVGTCHSVKGGQADVVLLSCNQSPKAARQYHNGDHGPIVRTMYVGMTRAREQLILCGEDRNGVPTP